MQQEFMKKRETNQKRAYWRSIKTTIRNKKEQFEHFLETSKFWQHKTHRFLLSESNPIVVRFTGRDISVNPIKSLLGVSLEAAELPKMTAQPDSKEVVISEFPSLGTLAIPLCLSTIVKLDRPIEEIMAGYSRSLRRSINKLLPKFKYETVNNESQIMQLERTMLRPYAEAKHNVGAAQLDIQELKRLALSEYGGLDILYEDAEQVGCHFGNSYVKANKNYWHVNRFGYTEAIYSDFPRWGEVNSINLHLALLKAISDGYDYCDYGVSLARPGSGLIEWKRRRKGFLSPAGQQFFYLKPPITGAADFFWGAPLFSVKNKNIALHLGIPQAKTEEEIAEKYHEMGYEGLQKVCLYCQTQPTEITIATINSLFEGQTQKPLIEIVIEHQ